MNNDIVSKLFLKYYQLTNGSPDGTYDPDDEWQNFCESLWKLLGYRGTEEVSIGISSLNVYPINESFSSDHWTLKFGLKYFDASST